MTGLVPDLKERQKSARARAGRIRLGIKDYINTLGWIAQARAEDDHQTLGYDSWAEYVDAEFGDGRLQLPPEMRQKAITELRLAGASQREIAHTVGVSQPTVQRALAGDSYESPAEDVDAGRPVIDALKQAINDATDRATDHRESEPGVPGVPAPTEEVGGPSVPSTSSTPEPDRMLRGPAPQSPDPMMTGPGGSAGEPESSPDGSAREAGVGTAMPAPAPEERTEEGPPCEACGVLLDRATWDLGFTRCRDCDPDGDHIVAANGEGCGTCPPTCPTCGRAL